MEFKNKIPNGDFKKIVDFLNSNGLELSQIEERIKEKYKDNPTQTGKTYEYSLQYFIKKFEYIEKLDKPKLDLELNDTLDFLFSDITDDKVIEYILLLEDKDLDVLSKSIKLINKDLEELKNRLNNIKEKDMTTSIKVYMVTDKENPNKPLVKGDFDLIEFAEGFIKNLSDNQITRLLKSENIILDDDTYYINSTKNAIKILELNGFNVNVNEINNYKQGVKPKMLTQEKKVILNRIERQQRRLEFKKDVLDNKTSYDYEENRALREALKYNKTYTNEKNVKRWVALYNQKLIQEGGAQIVIHFQDISKIGDYGDNTIYDTILFETEKEADNFYKILNNRLNAYSDEIKTKKSNQTKDEFFSFVREVAEEYKKFINKEKNNKFSKKKINETLRSKTPDTNKKLI